MAIKQTTGCYNPEFLVSDDVINASDIMIDTALKESGTEPSAGTIIHTAGYGVIKERGLDGHWTEV